MAKEELLELDGIVDEVLPDSRYRVTLDNGVVVGAYASGRMRKNHIRILAGDRVTLELSVYDLTKGRINFRHKDERSVVAAAQPAVRNSVGAKAGWRRFVPAHAGALSLDSIQLPPQP
jgi:translation initiation factor IF-1